MGRVTTRRPVTRIAGHSTSRRPDTLVVEEPLQLLLGGRPLVVTMRTPGADLDLVRGFLLAEGIIGGRNDIVAARYCAGTGEDGANTYNVIDVALADPTRAPEGRNFLSSSACGVCGKTSLEQVRATSRFALAPLGLQVDTATLAGMVASLRARQRVFDATGGVHAAGLFTADGEPLVVREDVGRHNAVDKVLGWAVEQDLLPLSRAVLIVSGRASFELVQKAVMAGVPVLGAVSAPSSLAVDLAREAGLTLVGFLRGCSLNVYAGEQRVSEPGRVRVDTGPLLGW
jgi:FdhD protein